MQDVLCITGGRELRGNVRVSGAKNGALPLLFATLLTSEPCYLHNIPDLEDIGVSLRLLHSLGAQTSFDSGVLSMHTPDIRGTDAPYSLVKSLRASFWALGPLLARAGRAQVSLPGGDAIGTRPVDLHLHGLSCLGAEFQMSHGVVIGTAPHGLRPGKVNFSYPSVGATYNVMMAASLIPGETVIEGAAREPEISDLAKFLCAMGAEIEGAGTACIRVRGKKELDGASHQTIGDRIEAATYLLSGAVTAGEVSVSGITPDALSSTLEVISDMGCTVSTGEDSVTVSGGGRLRGASFSTAPFPGVATDVQPLLLAALTRAEGVSRVRETVFESRFGHVAEYRRFGASIVLEGSEAVITGVDTLSAAPVESRDIRAAAGLVLMGVMADGVTQVRELYHLDRGYAGLVEKMKVLGADISRIPSLEDQELVVGC